MRRVLWIGLVLLVAIGSAMPVSAAANAEFQGNCTNRFTGGVLYTDCLFDANRTPSGSSPTTCSPSSVANYFWDYGDGTSSGFTSSTFVSHTYTGQGDWWINLGVFCNNATSDTTSHCMINYVGIYGCILPGGGWMP